VHVHSTYSYRCLNFSHNDAALKKITRAPLEIAIGDVSECKHYRYEDDILLAKGLGVTHLRVSLEWHRCDLILAGPPFANAWILVVLQDERNCKTSICYRLEPQKGLWNMEAISRCAGL
jgi:hypothetical protein